MSELLAALPLLVLGFGVVCAIEHWFPGSLFRAPKGGR